MKISHSVAKIIINVILDTAFFIKSIDIKLTRAIFLNHHSIVEAISYAQHEHSVRFPAGGALYKLFMLGMSLR